MAMEDVFSRARANYECKVNGKSKKIGPGHNKVLARDKECFITALPKKSHQDYIRRKRQSNAGYHSVCYLPYKTFGNLNNIDCYELLTRCLGISLNKQHLFPQTHCRRDVKEDSHKIIVTYNFGVKQDAPLPPSNYAGLEALYKEVASFNRAIIDIKAGTSLIETIRRESQRQDVWDSIKPPKIISEGGEDAHIRRPRLYLPPILHTASSKICMVSVCPTHLVPPGGMEAGGHVKKMTMPETGKTVTEEICKTIVTKNFFAKVVSIHAILSCLHNIKNRDLRSWEPLPFETIKAFSKRPQHLSTKDQTLIAPPVGIQHQHYHQYLHPDSKNPKPKQLINSKIVWEDILDNDNLHEFITPSTRDTDASPTPSKPRRTVPAWKRKIVRTENKEQDMEQDPAQRVDDCIVAFRHFKSKMDRQTCTTLKERKEMRDKNFTLKLEHFVLGPNRDKSLQEMRTKIYQINWTEQQQSRERDKPEWFILLEDEMKCISKDGIEINGKPALGELKQFMYTENSTIPMVFEKLCFLVMSVPPHYLCTAEVLSAFKFVCESILHASPRLIDKLREMRRLPPVTDLHPPQYLFGVHICGT